MTSKPVVSVGPLKSAVCRLFELLDIVEESDSGNPFRPNQLSSCRVMDGIEIEGVLAEMRRLTRAGPCKLV